MGTTRARAVGLVLAMGLCAGPALAGCGGGGSGHKGGEPTPSTSSRSVGGINPLTGLDGKPTGPVVGVKIDDTASGRPPIGLNDADLVYVELAEGGLTRLLAMYASRRPMQVGPVRSVRASDPELLQQYGPVALAFSGGAAKVVDIFHSSPLADGSPDAHPDAYHRDTRRPAPYNLVVNLATLSTQVKKAGGARALALRWSTNDVQSRSAAGATQMSVRMQSTDVSFRFDSGTNQWVRTIGGSTVTDSGGKPVSTPNVLVQFCDVSADSSDVDQAGNPSAFTHTVGEGKAVLFRGAHRVEGTWRRKTADDSTRFVDTGGTDMALRPGGAWLLLAPAGSPLDSR